jgi:hypothetical protein
MITYLSLIISSVTVLFLFVLSVILNSDHTTFAQQEKVLSSSNESNKILGAIASNLFGNNFSQQRLLQPQHQPLSFNGSNESNKVLGAIASNLWSSNPNMMIGGHGPPNFSTSQSKPDIQAKEEGFLVAEEKDFKVSYPLNWIKNKDLNSRFTGVRSSPIVSFSVPNFDTSTSKGSWVGIAKYIIGNHPNRTSVLYDYIKEEINELESNVSFQLNESSPANLGENNKAQKLMYTSNVVDSSPALGAEVVGHRKTMEIIAVEHGEAYFFVYSASANEYPTYLPYVKKMISSFEFMSSIKN